MSGRTHHTLGEERVRALLEESCEADESGRISFGELKKLAHLMDDPLIKIGWNPVQHEPTPGSGGVPDKLCDFLAENRRLSTFLSPERSVTDELGNEL